MAASFQNGFLQLAQRDHAHVIGLGQFAFGAQYCLAQFGQVGIALSLGDRLHYAFSIDADTTDHPEDDLAYEVVLTNAQRVQRLTVKPRFRSQLRRELPHVMFVSSIVAT